MPEIIINTSPLQYLYQIGKLEILQSLYGEILVPYHVREEINAGRNLQFDLPVIENYSWMKVVQSSNFGLIAFPSILGKGEKEAMAIALEYPNSTLILDDQNARKFAKALGIRITGTLGVLLKAKECNYIDSVQV